MSICCCDDVLRRTLSVDIVVAVRMMDAEFSSTTFVIFDVELRNQLGGPVPAAVAALALSGKDWQPLWRVHLDISEERTLSSEKPRTPRLPHELPAGSAGLALREIERHLTTQPHRIVAAVGIVEAALLRNERAACPTLASLTLWDAVALGRRACPDVEGGLEQLAVKLGVHLRPGRRPATQEAWAVAQVFQRAVERGATAGRWSKLSQLEEIAGTTPKPVEEKYLPPPAVQDSLFD
ncbi:hypothetical protein [Streptomyces sp. NPDC058268]|uniref:hypothetical protein n=1 Tax=Streptomyces sp. NPDC058268 TaxID=3346413 RepID=UPI0036E6F6FD